MIAQIADDRKKCTGCGMCANICASQSIEMDYDKDGFLTPVIRETCIECGLCYKKCPVNKPVSGHDINETMVGSSKNKSEILNGCTSGGIAFESARWIVSQNGVVFGARFSEDFCTAYHCAAMDETGIQRFKGSKYIQSETRNCFYQTKKELNRGRKVLFIGTPCQVAGLKAYLEHEFDDLVTIDFMCHGIMSTRLYHSYLESLDLKMPLKQLNFRDKSKGYNLNYLLAVTDADSKEIKVPWYSCPLGMAFANNIINRASCSTCAYATNSRMGDISLADFVDGSNTAYERENGASLITVNTTKGKKLMDEITAQVDVRPFEVDIAKKLRHFYYPPVKHKNRDAVFENIETMSFAELNQKFFCKYEPAPIP